MEVAWAATLEQPGAGRTTRADLGVRHPLWRMRTTTGEVMQWVPQAVTKDAVAVVLTGVVAVVLTAVADSTTVTRAARAQSPMVTRAARAQAATVDSKTTGVVVAPRRAMRGGCVTTLEVQVAPSVTRTGAATQSARFLATKAQQILLAASTVTKIGAGML